MTGAIGVALIVNGAAGSTTRGSALVATGTALVVLGAALLNRLVLSVVAWLTGRSGLSLRFVTRDADRNGQRTGPAVVASMLALAATVGGVTFIATYEAEDRQALEGGTADELVLSIHPGARTGEPMADMAPFVDPVKQAISNVLPRASVEVSTSLYELEVGEGSIESGALYADVDLDERADEVDVQRMRAAVLYALEAGMTDGAPSVRVGEAELGNYSGWTLGAIAGGSAVSLLVRGLVAALSRSETQQEMVTLHALGISPRRRRRLGGAAAGVLALVAGGLAVPAGVVPAVALLHARYDARAGVNPPIIIPWVTILALVAGVALILTAAGWIAAGRQKEIVGASALSPGVVGG